VKNFPVIVINYFTAAILGFALNSRTAAENGHSPAVFYALGILVALAGVLLTIYKKRTQLPEPASIYLPVVLFFGMGSIASLIKHGVHSWLG
jgi:hypothetical protein